MTESVGEWGSPSIQSYRRQWWVRAPRDQCSEQLGTAMPDLCLLHILHYSCAKLVLTVSLITVAF